MAHPPRTISVDNVSSSAVIVEKGRVADNFFTRLRGLIGVRELAPGDGLWIKPCSSIHCMFMSIPIDVLYLDKGQRVVGIDRNVRPWRMGHFYRKVHSVVELPIGALDRSTVAVGDQLRVTPC